MIHLLDSSAMKQLSIRGFDEELEQRLHLLAKEENISLNKATLKLLRQATGLDKKAQQSNVVGDALDEFIDVWSKDEEKNFNDAIKGCEIIDESLWQ